MDLTAVSGEITALLGPARAEQVRRSLEYTTRFACPVCGRYGDAGQEPADALLYVDMGIVQRPGGPTIDMPPGPAEPAVLRWWLTRTHRGCAGPRVVAWPSPGSGPDDGGQSTAVAEPGVLAGVVPGAPPHGWDAVIAPVGDGLAVMHWWQAVPAGYVVRGPGWSGEERLVDDLTGLLRDRGAWDLTGRLELDQLTDAPHVHGWYAELTAPGPAGPAREQTRGPATGTGSEPGAGSVTVWTVPALQDRLARSGAPAVVEGLRRPLCTVDGLPAAWVAAARHGRRILLVVHPPTLWAAAHAGVRVPGPADPMVFRARLDRPLGGLVHAGSVPDTDRAASAAPASRPPRPAAPPIDVDRLWQAARQRAGDLGRAARADRVAPAGRRLTVEPELLLALVLTALARVHDQTPQRVSVAEAAHRLGKLEQLYSWLDTVLSPTSVRADLAAARQVRAGGVDLDPFGTSMPMPAWILAEQAQQVAARQWLINAGGLRLGDRVRVLPPAGVFPSHLPHLGDGPVTIATAPSIGWPVLDHPEASAATAFTTRPGRSSRVHPGTDLLLADDSDPRALPHAVYSALTDLRTNQPGGNDHGLSVEYSRHLLLARAAHHTIPAVRDCFDQIAAAPTASTYKTAVVDAIGRLEHLSSTDPT
ncbi:hypothetical protein AB0M46_23450 [Dactylosporangium sp. NPDC051485]|uniref:hypothetical protein n=1 Tax=Dactylosporangium sp. NPDC051485 TaxID=3154846 RepID=UPI00343050DC